MIDQTLHVLLVEDEALNRALVRAILQRSDGPPGIELVEAETIEAARQALDSGPVDVVLLDVRLPDGSGLDLARDLRERPGPVPLIAILSASVLADERERAEASGADAFMGKPFAPRELVALLEDFRGRIAARLAPDG